MSVKIVKYFKKGKKSDQGFTLVEMLVVIIIVGILGAVAVPVYTKHSSSAKAAIAFNGISAIVRYVEGSRVGSDTGIDYPASDSINTSDIVQDTRNFAFSYTASAVVATGKDQLTSSDTITYNLSSGSWDLTGILSGITIPAQ